MKPEYIHKSRRLAFLLRHDSSYAFDEHGWRTIEDLIQKHGFTFDEIEYIVEHNNKRRFEFNNDRSSIRACQGHSVKVDAELVKATPPDVLYHGTSEGALESILRDGLEPRSRLYVHLSGDIDTARKVGSRHGKPRVLSIDASQMSAVGFEFYLSHNGVWLTKAVPASYLSLIL